MDRVLPGARGQEPVDDRARAADGMVLVHCFAGCSAESIIGACGLQFDDLFPEKLPQDEFKPLRSAASRRPTCC
jgi:hypothetical protein